MDFIKYKIQIYSFLDKNYYIKEDKFFTKYRDIHEWGRSIVDSLTGIFSVEQEISEDILKHWAYSNGVSFSDYEKALGPKKLKVNWSPEMAQDLSALHGISDAETRLTSILAEQIAAEIDSEILKKLKGDMKTSADLISLVKCIGYEPSTTEYDAADLRPKKYFISMNFNDIENERQINTHWQDWVRTREQDKKA